jgi:hypothetical protein
MLIAIGSHDHTRAHGMRAEGCRPYLSSLRRVTFEGAHVDECEDPAQHTAGVEC